MVGRIYTRVQQTFWNVGQNVKSYLQAGQILPARKMQYICNIYIYIHKHLFYYVDIYICVARLEKLYDESTA